MRSRLGLAFLIAVGSCLAFAGSASACQITHLKLDPSAGPGDSVSYSISGIEPTASYSFTIAGEEISGTNTTTFPGVSGTFTMPDLGSQPLTLTAHGTCSCPENADTQELVDSMQYLPPPPAAAATGAPAASPQPAAQSPSPHSRHSHRPASPVAVAKHAEKNQRDNTPSRRIATGAPPADSIGNGSNPHQPRSQSGRARHATSESSSVPHRVLHALTSTTKVGPADVPTIGLLLMAVIFIVGTGLAASVVYISQTGPDPRAAIKAPAPLGHDPVEVELQEMIATEMARQLLSDLDLGEPFVSSR